MTHTHARKMEVALKLTENESLRGMQNEDGVWYFSVYDFVNFVTGHEPGSDYAYQTFKRLVKARSEHAEAVLTNCQDCQFPGERQRPTPCMTIRGLQRLLMILGGKVASQYREIVEGVFTRYMAGDTSLIEEIRDNAASDAPVNVMARTASSRSPSRWANASKSTSWISPSARKICAGRVWKRCANSRR